MTDLNAKSKKFWLEASEGTTKNRWVNFVDDVPQIIEIEDWNIVQCDSPWGKKPAIVCKDGKYLKMESQRLKFCLSGYVGKYAKVEIIRHDSTPNSQNTWYEVKTL